MRILKAIAISCSVFFAALPTAQAEEKQSQPYLYEAAETNPGLESSFKEIVAPVLDQSPWLSDYGTAAPAEDVRIDEQEYLLFWGCKPHACVSESYVVLYSLEDKVVVAGALLKNNFDENNDLLKSAEITWLGDTQWDQASVISKHLY